MHKMQDVKSYDRIIETLFLAIVFIGLFVFFTVVHPLYIYDVDDWMYIVLRRKAIPMWKNWNPTKVLPETLMPLTAELGIRLFMPFSGDYIQSMAIAFALTLSAFYTIYIFLLCRLLSKKLETAASYRVLLGIFIVLVHFLPFLKSTEGNAYMYASGNVTCVFNYTIPALLNASLVLLFSRESSVENFHFENLVKQPKLPDGIRLLMVYLAINSNMYQSILLMAYIASVLILQFVWQIVSIKKFSGKFLLLFCKNNILWILGICVWLASLFMESQGGRAVSLEMSESYPAALVNAVRAFIETICGLNHFFVAMAVVVIVTAFCTFLLNRKRRTIVDREYGQLMSQYLISMIITIVYLVLVCARTDIGYLRGSSVFSGILFYVFLLMWVSLAYILRKIPFLIHVMPIVCYILFFATIINKRSYREVNISSYDSAIVKAIDDDILEQVLAADCQGRDSMELYVPVYDTAGNWPLSVRLGGARIADALYVHGVISRKMEITVVPDEKMNDKYQLP